MTSAEAAAVDESFHDLPLELAVQARAQVHEQSDTPLAEPWTLATWPHVPTRVLVGCGDRVLPVPALTHMGTRPRTRSSLAASRPRRGI